MQKIILLSILLFVFKAKLFSQQHLVTNWADYYAGGDSIQDVGLAVDADNCIFVAGEEYNNATQNDIVLMKFLPNGQREWVKTIDKNNKYEQFTKIHIGKDCSILVAFISSDFNLNIATTIVAKYDSLGNNIWTYEYDAGNSSAMVRGVDFEIDNNDNINVVGNISSTDANAGTPNFAFQLSETGSLLWQTQWSGNNLIYNYPTDLSLDTNGNLLIGGNGFGAGTSYSLIYKIDLSGNFIWETVLNSSFNSQRQIKKVGYSNNKIYTAGSTSNNGDGTIEFYTCDNSGNIINSWAYGEANIISADFQDWLLDSQGNILLTGSAESTTTANDVLIMKYDAQGNVIWQHRFDGPSGGSDGGRKIKMEANGNIVVGGTTRSATGPDFTVLRYDANGTFIDTMVYTSPGGFTKDNLGDLSIRSSNEIYVTGAAAAPNGGPVSIVTVKFGLPAISTPNSCANPFTLQNGTNTVTLADSVYWVKFIPDSNSVRIFLEEGNTVSNITKVILYKGCDTLLMESDAHFDYDSVNTVTLNYYQLKEGDEYYLKVKRSCNACILSVENINISLVNYNLRINTLCFDPFFNGGFENFRQPLCSDSPFTPHNDVGGHVHCNDDYSQVYGWFAYGSSNPQLYDIDSQNHGATMWVNNAAIDDGEGIVKTIGLIIGKTYRLSLKCLKRSNTAATTNGGISVAFFDPANLLVPEYFTNKQITSGSFVTVEACFVATKAFVNLVIKPYWSGGTSNSNEFWVVVDDVKMELIDGYASSDQVICDGECAHLEGFATCVNQDEIFSWNGSVGQTIDVCPRINTTYNFTYQVGACFISDPVNITVKPKINATISGLTYICSTTSQHPVTTLACTTTPISAPSGTTYQWYLNGIAISGATNSNYDAFQAGNYYCTVNLPSTSSYCGTTSNSVPVVVLDDIQCCIYFSQYNKINYSASTAFNNQGVNQTWKPNNNPLNGGAGSDVTIRETLTIPQGVTVTIKNMNLKFAPTGKVYIEAGNSTTQGGKLILDATILTSGDLCGGNYMWLGVEVGGVTSAAQGTISSSQQGWLKMTNSTIENAWNGVTLAYTNYTGSLNNTYPASGSFASTAGGVIQAAGSSFLNNFIDVRFSSYIYKNPYSNQLLDNVCSFDNCNFTTNAILNNTQSIYPYAHVANFSTRNVKFNGCTFQNVSSYISSAAVTNWGMGIYAHNSIFKIQNNNNVNSKFKNQYIGVNAVGFLSNLFPFLCTKTDFENCKIGVNTSNIAGCEVSKCTLKVYNETSSQLTNASIGISLTNSTGYKIEENVLSNNTNAQPSNNTFGILANNSGTANNRIYNNTFQNLRKGIQYQNTNKNNSGSTGLRTKCNKFYVNTITDESNVLPTNIDYIAANQGYYSNNSTLLPAGNSFFNSGASSDFQNNNQNGAINYVYHNDADRTPQNVIGNITLTAAPVTYTEAQSCPSSYGSGNGGGNGNNPGHNPNKQIRQNIKSLENTVAQLGIVNPNNIDQVSFLNAQKQFLLDELLRDYLLYGNYPNAYDSIKQLYDEFDVYTALDKVQPYTAMQQDSLALIKLNEAIMLQGNDAVTDYMMSFFNINKGDSAELVNNLDAFVYESDFGAKRRAIDVKGFVTNAPVYPEIHNGQPFARLMQSNNKESSNLSAEIAKSNFYIAPNPANDILILSLARLDAEYVLVEFIDAKGLTLQKEKLNALYSSINISGLQSGSYIVRITNGNSIENAKLQIVK